MRGPHAGMADAVMSSIKGVQDAQHLLHALREGCVPADLLFDAIGQVHALNDTERLRSFARHIQKTLERAA